MTTLIAAFVVIAGVGLLVIGLVYRPPARPVRLAPRERRAAMAAKTEDPAWVTAFARIVRRFQPPARRDRIEKVIRRAGQPEDYSIDRILAYKFLGAAVFGTIGFLFFINNPGALGFIAFVVGVVAGYVVPEMLISNRADARRREVQTGLADAVDQLAVMVRAGLSVDAGLARVADSLHGPIAEEFSRVVQDIAIGTSRADALRAMATRVDLPELNYFVRALVQSDALGVPISDTLAAQAEDMRSKRRLRAEEEAMKLPVKILAPIMACIVPALLIVVIGPAVIQLLRNLG